MIQTLRTNLWQQIGASLDMLENAIQACPEAVWGTNTSSKTEFWYLVFHTLYWFDNDMSASSEVFAPPVPFNNAIPKYAYSKAELLSYLEFGRNKCRNRMQNLTEENVQQKFVSEGMTFTVLELMLYALRHVQHHAAQLNLLLRQQTQSAPKWVRRTKQTLKPRK